MKGEQVQGGDSLRAPISRQMVEKSSSRSRERMEGRDRNIEKDADLPTDSDAQTSKHGGVTGEERGYVARIR